MDADCLTMFDLIQVRLVSEEFLVGMVPISDTSGTTREAPR